MQHVFDDYSFREVAEVVMVTNPFVRANSVDELVAYMKRHTTEQMHEPGYWGCQGFFVTSYRPAYDPDNLHHKATLDSYTIKQYLKVRGLIDA
jgi:hypothetical protein